MLASVWNGAAHCGTFHCFPADRTKTAPFESRRYRHPKSCGEDLERIRSYAGVMWEYIWKSSLIRPAFRRSRMYATYDAVARGRDWIGRSF